MAYGRHHRRRRADCLPASGYVGADGCGCGFGCGGNGNDGAGGCRHGCGGADDGICRRRNYRRPGYAGSPGGTADDCDRGIARRNGAGRDGDASCYIAAGNIPGSDGRRCAGYCCAGIAYRNGYAGRYSNDGTGRYCRTNCYCATAN